MAAVVTARALKLDGEISMKLRSTIKSKLVEYGAYVDNELPDYIMVMIANKKPVNSMRNDLNLFLNENTDPFIEWLFEVLKKILPRETGASSSNNVSSTSNAVPATSDKAKADSSAVPPPNVHVSEPNLRVPQGTAPTDLRAPPVGPSIFYPSSSSSFATQPPHKPPAFSFAAAAQASDVTNASGSMPIPAASSVMPTPPQQQIRRPISPPSSAPRRRSSRERDRDRERERERERDREREREREGDRDGRRDRFDRGRYDEGRSRRGAGSRHERRRRFSGGEASSSRRRSRSNSRSRSRSPARGQPGPGASRRLIGNRVFSQALSGLNSRNPSRSKDWGQQEGKGVEEEEKDLSRSVPSVVKVTDRRSALLPARLAPNKNLLLRAVREAHVSVQQRKKAAEEAAEEANNEPSTSTDKLPDRPLGPKKGREREEVDHNEAVLDLMDDLEQLEEGTAGREETETKFIVTLDGVEADFLKSLEQAVDEEEGNQIDEIDEDPPLQRSPEDLRFQLQRWAASGRFAESTSFKERRDHLLQSLGKRKEAMRKIQRQQLLKERLVLQKRLETLEKATGRKPIEAPESDPPAGEEAMEEEEDEEGPPERCRFFPNCQKKECPFFHPTEKCPHFPNCKFGDQCYYIHPNCRYDANCTRPDCNYQHTAQAFTAVLPPPPPPSMFLYAPPTFQPVRCRYHPHCQNPHCIYVHPTKPCRFGLACAAKDTCLFEHPSQPDRKQFKWSKSAAAAAAAAVKKSAVPAPETPAAPAAQEVA